MIAPQFKGQESVFFFFTRYGHGSNVGHVNKLGFPQPMEALIGNLVSEKIENVDGGTIMEPAYTVGHLKPLVQIS